MQRVDGLRRRQLSELRQRALAAGVIFENRQNGRTRPFWSKRANLDSIANPNEPTEDVPPVGSGDENPFPLTTEWFGTAGPFEFTDFSKTNLERANLSRTVLSGADLTEAMADDYTKWPEGFDPVAAGVIFED